MNYLLVQSINFLASNGLGKFLDIGMCRDWESLPTAVFTEHLETSLIHAAAETNYVRPTWRNGRVTTQGRVGGIIRKPAFAE